MGIIMAVAADAAPAVIAVPAGPRRFSREAGRGSRATSGADPSLTRHGGTPCSTRDGVQPLDPLPTPGSGSLHTQGVSVNVITARQAFPEARPTDALSNSL